jgi:hypothetical protein
MADPPWRIGDAHNNIESTTEGQAHCVRFRTCPDLDTARQCAAGNSRIGIMEPPKQPPKTVSELIDRIEQIREELLQIQQSLEQKERPKDRVAHEKSSK